MNFWEKLLITMAVLAIIANAAVLVGLLVALFSILAQSA